MRRMLRPFPVIVGLLVPSLFTDPVAAQKHGGILRLYSWDSPASVSPLDGPNPIGARTAAPVFNNLVMFDQHVKQSSLASIVPDLASEWTWHEDGTELTFTLRRNVKWHDGKPFPLGTSSAPGICCWRRGTTGCAAIR